jgi:hypothetical protein
MNRRPDACRGHFEYTGSRMQPGMDENQEINDLMGVTVKGK